MHRLEIKASNLLTRQWRQYQDSTRCTNHNKYNVTSITKSHIKTKNDGRRHKKLNEKWTSHLIKWAWGCANERQNQLHFFLRRTELPHCHKLLLLRRPLARHLPNSMWVRINWKSLVLAKHQAYVWPTFICAHKTRKSRRPAHFRY